MKQLTCEMCGGTDLMKQDGAFVCQNCGMKYSVEEAKKMMIEGTVDVQGTVKVDNTAFVQKYLANARRAMQKEDWEETEKYYNMVEQNDPTNIEAIFYSAYGKAKASLSVNEIYKREAIFKALRNSISLLDDNYDVNNSSVCNVSIDQIVTSIINMFGSSFVYTETRNGYGVTSDNRNQTYQMFIGLASEMHRTLVNIADKLTEEKKEEWLFIKKLDLKLVDFLTTPASHLSKDAIVQNCKIAAAIQNLIKKSEPSFVGKNYQEKIETAKKGCYVATAVYGSYDCPQVWTLRRYRDYTLAETWYGRAFIKTYYAISPTLVKWFGHTNWFKNMWKGKLDRMVAKLQANGVESTPYEDKNW